MTHETEIRRVALVVDDDPNSLMMVSEALETAGISAMVARDGEAALRLAPRLAPDVILLDAVMPGIDGFETCRRLKAQPGGCAAPVIFMTGLSASEHLVEGLAAGGVDYVTKPLNIEELLARLSVHLLTAQRLASAQRALDTQGRSVAAYDAEGGALIWSSPQARALLAAAPAPWLGPELAARGELIAWLRAQSLRPLSQASRLASEALEVSYLGKGAAGEVLIALHSRRGPAREQILSERFGLTEREGEVLFWVTQGKTNADIGGILGLSGRTVNKHLEQIFQKMGVDNRTSAAVMADRVFHGI